MNKIRQDTANFVLATLILAAKANSNLFRSVPNTYRTKAFTK